MRLLYFALLLSGNVNVGQCTNDRFDSFRIGSFEDMCFEVWSLLANAIRAKHKQTQDITCKSLAI